MWRLPGRGITRVRMSDEEKEIVWRLPGRGITRVRMSDEEKE